MNHQAIRLKTIMNYHFGDNYMEYICYLEYAFHSISNDSPCTSEYSSSGVYRKISGKVHAWFQLSLHTYFYVNTDFNTM